jgi:hypothetical protein
LDGGLIARLALGEVAGEVREVTLELTSVVGEWSDDLELAGIADEHHHVPGLQGAVEEVAELGEHPVSVLGNGVDVVDQDDQVKPLILRPRWGRGKRACRMGRSRGGQGSLGSRRRACPQLFFRGEEVGYEDRPAILEDREVLALQIVDRLAVPGGGEDLQVDDVDLHLLAERLLPGAGCRRCRRCRRRLGRPQAHRAGQQGEREDERGQSFRADGHDSILCGRDQLLWKT